MHEKWLIISGQIIMSLLLPRKRHWNWLIPCWTFMMSPMLIHPQFPRSWFPGWPASMWLSLYQETEEMSYLWVMDFIIGPGAWPTLLSAPSESPSLKHFMLLVITAWSGAVRCLSTIRNNVSKVIFFPRSSIILQKGKSMTCWWILLRFNWTKRWCVHLANFHLLRSKVFLIF